MRARPLALLLAGAVAVPVLVSSPATAATPQARATDHSCPAGQVQEDGFPDVAQTNAHEAAVDCVVHWRVAAGATSSAYRPALTVNRGQMASFVARVVERSGGALPTPSRDHFGDDDGTAHEQSINKLAEVGVVEGTGPGAFSPQAEVSRAQMAAFLTRVYDERARQGGRPPLPPGQDHFPDDDGSALRAEIDKAAAAGFVAGYADGTYRPGVAVLRDQMASFLSRVLDLVVESGMSSLPPGPRQLSSTGWRPYAQVGPVVLHAPGDVLELVGYHQSGHDGALGQAHTAADVRSTVLASRGRGTHPQSAADIVVDPSREVRSPVSGRVLRAGTYTLYCDHTDEYLVVEPDARPGYEVKLLHVVGLRVRPGDRVQAGTTVVAAHARVLPFRSQVDDHTLAPHWPHVHVEVVDTAVRDRPGAGC